MASNSAKPFKSYDEYMGNVFDCVNRCLYQYLEGMKGVYSNGQGGYKNVLYPDLEVASDSTKEQMQKFSWVLTRSDDSTDDSSEEKTKDPSESEEDSADAGDDFADFFGSFGEESEEEDTSGDMDELTDIFGNDSDLMDIFSSFGVLDEEGEEESDSGFGGGAYLGSGAKFSTRIGIIRDHGKDRYSPHRRCGKADFRDPGASKGDGGKRDFHAFLYPLRQDGL